MTDEKYYYGYERLSQDGRDDSLEAQREEIKEHAAELDDVRLVTILSDGENASGFDNERTAYTTVKRKVRNGDADGVIVRDRARLARDFDERLRLLLLFRETDAELRVTEEGGALGLGDVKTAAMEAMKAAFDHVAKRTEIERAQEVVEERLANGNYQGKPPYGFEFDGDGEFLVASQPEFDAAMRIIKLRDVGKPYSEITEIVEEEFGEEVAPSKSTLKKIVSRPGWYRSVDEGAVIGHRGPTHLDD